MQGAKQEYVNNNCNWKSSYSKVFQKVYHNQNGVAGIDVFV